MSTELTEEERAKGFVRPWRLNYAHMICGVEMRLDQTVAEGFARSPKFNERVYCAFCAEFYPVDEFRWVPDGGVLGL